MAAPGAAAGIPLTAAQGPFGATAAANGAGLHAHNFAAAAAAAAAAQQQQNAAVLSSQFHLAHQAQSAAGQAAVAAALKNSVAAVTSQTTTVGSSLVSGGTAAISSNICSSSSNSGVSATGVGASKLGSPAAKKFRPAFARPSHKGSRYIPKPIPQELGNLKTYSKPILIYISLCLCSCFCRPIYSTTNFEKLVVGQFQTTALGFEPKTEKFEMGSHFLFWCPLSDIVITVIDLGALFTMKQQIEDQPLSLLRCRKNVFTDDLKVKEISPFRLNDMHKLHSALILKETLVVQWQNEKVGS